MAASRDPSAGRAPEEGSSLGLLRLILSLHVPSIGMGLGQGLTMPVLPAVAKEAFGVGVETAALLFIIYMAGNAAASLPTGLIIDRIGRRRVLLAGPLLLAVSALLMAKAIISGSFVELLVYRFIAGWGEQMWMLSRITVITDTARPRQRGKQVTQMFGVQQAGALSGPIIGGFAAVIWGLWAPFIIQAGVVALAIIPSFYLVRETAPGRVRREPGARQAEDVRPKASWKEFLVYPVPLVLLVQFLANVTRGAVFGGGVLLLYGAYAYDADPATLGVLRGAMAVAGIPITFTTGFIMDRYGRKYTIVPGLVLAGLAMLFMAGTSFASLPFEAFIAAFVAVHLSINLTSGNLQTLFSDIAPAHARGRFFAVSQIAFRTGSLVSPSSFALLSGLASFGVAFAFLSSTALVGGLIVGLFVRETLKRDEQEEERRAPRAT